MKICDRCGSKDDDNHNAVGVEVTETSGFKPIVLEFQPEVVCGYTYVYPPPREFKEIRWDYENDSAILLKEKFENIARLIEEKMDSQSGVVCVSEHNYLLFAASTTGNFDHNPRIKFNDKHWLIIKNIMLEKDEIRIYPDKFEVSRDENM